MEMLLSGQLSERPVVSLIQEICQQPGTYILRVRSERNEVGTLTFYAGELLKADLGNLHGEAAMAELVNWQTGTFSLSPSTNTVQRDTVDHNENGQRDIEQYRLNRQRQLSRLQATVKEFDLNNMVTEVTAEEREIEYFLIALLSKLERFQTAMRIEAMSGQLLKAINALAAMIDETTSFINQRQRAQKRSLSLKNVVKQIGSKHESAYLFAGSDRALNTRNVGAVLRSKQLSQHEREALETEIQLAMVAVQTFLFGLILDMFSSELLQQQWQQTFQLILGDVRQVLDI